MTYSSRFMGLGSVFILLNTAQAGAPDSINFQGLLRDGLGNPVTVATNVAYRVYDGPGGGAALLWGPETHAVTPDGGGLYSVTLGSLVSFPEDLFAGTPRYLGIKVGGDAEVSPRTQIVSVPYSLSVKTVDGASGGTITSKVSIGPGHTSSGSNAFIAGESNTASGNVATVSGGAADSATGIASVVGGGFLNIARGNYNTVAGGVGNHAALHVDATVGGGESNSADNQAATVGGGYRSIASGFRSTVGGGHSNRASGSHATVGGGEIDRASAPHAMVPGGYGNVADGDYSFAAGRRAKAAGLGTFVWGDNNDFELFIPPNNRFSARATGGVRLVSAIDGLGNASAGVGLAAGGNSWSAISDRNSKSNVQSMDAPGLLEKLAALPISTWNYVAQADSIRHMGPMAQDFYAAFRVGEDDKYITTTDADGVTLAAIQGLYRIVQEQERRVEHLEKQLSGLRVQSPQARVK